MKFLIVGLLVLPLMGCGVLDKGVASWTGYSKMCVEGVSYLQFTSGATVQVDQEGRVVKCAK